jgi:hypothetical protein
MPRLAVCVTIAIVAFAGCSDTSERDSAGSEPAEEARTATSPGTVDESTTTLTPVVWPGAVHNRGVAVQSRGQDSLDAPLGWVDVVRVSTRAEDQAHWYIDLAARPPLAADVEPGLLIAYGLVFDTNGDAGADYLVGIDNDAPKPGDFRVWVTDLATGETDQQLGPPYGYPIEFSHPGEPEPPPGPPMMLFTFLGDSKPADLNAKTVRFYAWTSAKRDGQVVAYDYAPDAGWLTADKP